MADGSKPNELQRVGVIRAEQTREGSSDDHPERPERVSLVNEHLDEGSRFGRALAYQQGISGPNVVAKIEFSRHSWPSVLHVREEPQVRLAADSETASGCLVVNFLLADGDS